MFNCEKCWDNPCVCGHEYKNWSAKKIEEQIEMLRKVLATKKKDGGETDNMIARI